MPFGFGIPPNQISFHLKVGLETARPNRRSRGRDSILAAELFAQSLKVDDATGFDSQIANRRTLLK
jgi:hypothetical protein